jgi:hypothetical protein
MAPCKRGSGSCCVICSWIRSVDQNIIYKVASVWATHVQVHAEPTKASGQHERHDATWDARLLQALRVMLHISPVTAVWHVEMLD